MVHLRTFFLLLLLVMPSKNDKIIKDYSMSVTAMNNLVEIETSFINKLRIYENSLEDKINILESFIAHVRSIQQQWALNAVDYVSHPIKSFSLIRRLHEDWSFFELYMSHSFDNEYLEDAKNILNNGPTKIDILNAMESIKRLQHCYGLKPNNIVNNLLYNLQYKSTLDARDYYSIGKFYTKEKKYDIASEWFLNALKYFNIINEKEMYQKIYNMKADDIIGNYAQALINEGDIAAALTILDNASDSNAHHWLLRYQVEETLGFLPSSSKRTQKNISDADCPGTYSLKSYLGCHYQTKRTAFLTLAPLKVEVLSFHPYVAFIHDVIYDRRIARVKSILVQLLEGQHSTNAFLTSQTVQITSVKSKLKNLLSQEIDDMGLYIQPQTNFQILNYDFNGYFHLYTDNLCKPQQIDINDNSLSIVIFLNDVAEDGSIVLPLLTTAILPKKGSALIWENFKKLVH